MNSDSTQRPVRVGMISLGCAKNLVDAEIMLGSLLQSGVEITVDAARADVVIVNTCSFIDAAQEESVDAVLESAQVREARNLGQALIVSGCLPQRFRDDLPKLLPEVDAFMGIDQVAGINEIVRQALDRRSAKIRNGELKFQSSKLKAQSLEPGRELKVQGSKSAVVSRLAALGDAKPAKGESARGTEKPAKTKTILAPRPSPLAPVLDVHPRPTYIPDYATPRFRLTPRHLAYLKIAEGCNHPCSFCIIPRMRGSHRSRPVDDIVQEARQLLADGVKELNLISQDTTYYGLDLRPNHRRAIAGPDRFVAAARQLPADAPTICRLVRELNALPGTFWIRLLYTHPAHWTDELIRTIAECPKVARYVDMPLQHIHPNLLERMRRETSQEYIVDLIRRIRTGVPGIALRTTFIVGFPGETEASFQTLLDFTRETKFERLGVFTYSREQGTRAAKMEGQVPDRVKQRRRDLVMAAQQELARHISASFLGRTINVLVEKKAGDEQLNGASAFSWEHGLIRQTATRNPEPGTRNYFVARGEADAPDIDGRGYVRGKLPSGEFARVRIVGHTDYDLIAEPA